MIELSHESLRARRHNHVVTDLRYLLQIEGMPRFLCTERLDLVETWMDTIGLVDKTDTQSRLFGAHREFPSDQWMHAFNLTLSLSSMFQCILQWLFDPATCATDPPALALEIEKLLTIVSGRVIKMMQKHPICFYSRFLRRSLRLSLRRADQVHFSCHGKRRAPTSRLGPSHFISPCTDFFLCAVRSCICSSTRRKRLQQCGCERLAEVLACSMPAFSSMSIVLGADQMWHVGQERAYDDHTANEL